MPVRVLSAVLIGLLTADASVKLQRLWNKRTKNRDSKQPEKETLLLEQDLRGLEEIQCNVSKYSYDYYKIVLNDFVPEESDVELNMIVGDKGGLETSGYNNYVVGRREQPHGAAILGGNLLSDFNSPNEFTILLRAQKLRREEKRIEFNGHIYSSSGIYVEHKGWARKDTEEYPITQFKIFLINQGPRPSVRILSGNFKLYGIKE